MVEGELRFLSFDAAYIAMSTYRPTNVNNDQFSNSSKGRYTFNDLLSSTRYGLTHHNFVIKYLYCLIINL